MNVLIDTNIALDVLLKREPYFSNSQLVLLSAERKYIKGFVSASAITDIFYITNKIVKNNTTTRNILKKHLLGTVYIATVDEETVLKALDAEWEDFEDCLQYFIGDSINADYIVTRNPKDFVNEDIVVVTPEELLDIIAPEQEGV